MATTESIDQTLTRPKIREIRRKQRDRWLEDLFEGFEHVDLGKAFEMMRGYIIHYDGTIRYLGPLPRVRNIPPYVPEDERPYAY